MDICWPAAIINVECGETLVAGGSMHMNACERGADEAAWVAPSGAADGRKLLVETCIRAGERGCCKLGLTTARVDFMIICICQTSSKERNTKECSKFGK